MLTQTKGKNKMNPINITGIPDWVSQPVHMVYSHLLVVILITLTITALSIFYMAKWGVWRERKDI